MSSMAISSAECSTWLAVFLTITFAVVPVNLLSSHSRYVLGYKLDRGWYAFWRNGHFCYSSSFPPHYACESIHLSDVFLIAERKWRLILLVIFMPSWLSLTSVTGIAVISLDRMHATFRPFGHRNIKKWAYGVAIVGVWILPAIILIPLPLISLYENLQQQWQLLFPEYFRWSYCCLCLVAICVSYTSIALKFWCGTRLLSHGAANRQRKLTLTLFI